MSMRIDGQHRSAGIEQLRGQETTRSASGGDNPLSGHSAAIGERGPSVGERFKHAMGSFFSAIATPFVALGRMLASIPAVIGEAFTSRRQNSARAEGPGELARETVPHRLADARDAALRDPDLRAIAAGGQNQVDSASLMRFFGNHFEVCSSPEFWSHSHARMNADNFGCGLALTVLERIQQNGEVTQQDLQDLHRTLGPYVGPGAPPVPPPSADLLGDLDDDKLGELARLVFDRYAAPDAAFPLNMQGSEHETTCRATFADQQATGAEKLQSLRDAYVGALGSQYLGPDNLRGPLQAIG